VDPSPTPDPSATPAALTTVVLDSHQFGVIAAGFGLLLCFLVPLLVIAVAGRRQ